VDEDKNLETGIDSAHAAEDKINLRSKIFSEQSGLNS